ncbi:MAG: 3-hydroxyacyl-ACP dehydratase FabZ [Candidatus Handelsmanbacteria bacterium]|nr:3-hydroxyacyl-ACP dehydratase FabZ [Candidatus Handelsmanbacteria bacterium]
MEGTLDLKGIMEVLPHRYPLLLVDRIVELVPGERVVGLKNVSANEACFQGHFPGHPVMPGVLIIEALAQTGAVMMLRSLENAAGKIPFFAGIDKARFRRQVVPGDQLRLELKVLQQRAGTCKLEARAYVGEELAAEAEILAVVR